MDAALQHELQGRMVCSKLQSVASGENNAADNFDVQEMLYTEICQVQDRGV
jgi:hypothetical protein